MVAKTVMVYSRQVIMTGHLILKMQSMLMLTGANGMFFAFWDIGSCPDKMKSVGGKSFSSFFASSPVVQG